MQAGIEDIFRRSVIPVLTVPDPDLGIEIARALLGGGLDVLEVTLRTERALDAVERVASVFPEIIVGVGTVLEASDLVRSEETGARFAVSPGASETLAGAAQDAGIPWLPGAATVSESMRLLEWGCRFQKLFPAGPSGGPAFLKAVSAPIPEVVYCPTGGIDAGNAPTYLECPNVAAVGGSWVVPVSAVAARDWSVLTGAAREAAALARAWPGAGTGRGRR